MTADPQDVRDLRWLIVMLLRFGKRTTGRHVLNIAGKDVSVFPDTNSVNLVIGYDLNKIHIVYEVSALDFEANITLTLPKGVITKPPTMVTRFDGESCRVEPYPNSVLLTTMPLYFESMVDQENFTGKRLTQHDPRVLEYWMSLYGVVKGSKPPSIDNLAGFRSTVTASLLTVKNTTL